jgi:hypothetical protein
MHRPSENKRTNHADGSQRQHDGGAAEAVRQMLAKKPSDRPASMKDVLQQLRSIRLVERVAV